MVVVAAQTVVGFVAVPLVALDTFAVALVVVDKLASGQLVAERLELHPCFVER